MSPRMSGHNYLPVGRFACAPEVMSSELSLCGSVDKKRPCRCGVAWGSGVGKGPYLLFLVAFHYIVNTTPGPEGQKVVVGIKKKGQHMSSYFVLECEVKTVVQRR